MDAVPHQENETTKPTEDTTTITSTPEAKSDDAASAVVSEASAEAIAEPAADAKAAELPPEVVEPVAADEKPDAIVETVAEPQSVIAEAVETPAEPVAEEPVAVIADKKPAASAHVTSEEQSTIVRSLKFKPAPEPRWRRVLEQQGYKAAAILIALGAGWIVGAHSFSTGPQTREIIEALNAVTTRLEDVEHLTTRLNAQAQDVAAMKASIASLRSIADANRAEAQVASAQLAARVSNMPQPVQQDLAPILRRLEQLESAAAAQSAAQPTEQRAVVPPAARQVTARIPADGYVLRRVSGNVAVIETSSGLRQVMVGDYLPAAGRVRRIERRNGAWVVITSEGIIDQQSY